MQGSPAGKQVGDKAIVVRGGMTASGRQRRSRWANRIHPDARMLIHISCDVKSVTQQGYMTRLAIHRVDKAHRNIYNVAKAM